MTQIKEIYFRDIPLLSNYDNLKFIQMLSLLSIIQYIIVPLACILVCSLNILSYDVKFNVSAIIDQI
jgi:hypothetical protein